MAESREQNTTLRILSMFRDGPCDEEFCWVHRPLAGLSSRHLFSAIMATLLSFGACGGVSGGISFGRGGTGCGIGPSGDDGPTLPPIYAYNYLPAFVAEKPPSPVGASRKVDRLVGQVPFAAAWIKKKPTWVVLFYESGRVVVAGDRAVALAGYGDIGGLSRLVSDVSSETGIRAEHQQRHHFQFVFIAIKAAVLLLPPIVCLAVGCALLFKGENQSVGGLFIAYCAISIGSFFALMWLDWLAEQF